MSINREALTALYLFQYIEAPALDELLASSTARSLTPGEVIITEGAPADSAFLLVSGRLEARIIGGDRVLGDIRPGEIVGETALLTQGGRRGASVIALDPSEVLELTPTMMRSAASNPAVIALERHLLGTMVRRLRGMSLDIQKILQETQPVEEESATPLQTISTRLRSFFKGWSS